MTINSALSRCLPAFRRRVLCAALMGLAAACPACDPRGDDGVSPSAVRNDVTRVVLISIDTCRADHLGCYGYPEPITPNIDAIASDGVVFTRALAPTPVTLPSHCTMLTGMDPPRHGVRDNFDYRLDDNVVTLAELLKADRFATGAVIGAVVLDSEYGLDQGFDTYDDRFEDERRTMGVVERQAHEVSRSGASWLEEHAGEPFFLFLHYYDPHAEYMPPEPYATQFPDRLYAGEIAYVDRWLGDVVDTLKRLGIYDTTLLIVTSDHGEMLEEHGELTHGFFIYQSALRVPLIIKAPRGPAGRRVDAWVGVVDLLPTIAALTGVPVPDGVEGVNLADLLSGAAPGEPPRALYCESLTPTKYRANALWGVVSGGWKYIHAPHPELYDLIADPGEQRNRFSDEPARSGRMRDLLEGMRRRRPAWAGGGGPASDDRTQRQMESIGYVAGRKVSEDVDIDTAKADAKDVIDLNNRYAHLVALSRMDHHAEVREACQGLIRDYPDFAGGHLGMGVIAMNEGSLAAARDHLRRAVELDPDFAEAHGTLGQALESLGMADDAIEHYREALRVRPSNISAHEELARALSSQGRFDEAVGHWREVVKARPDRADVQHRLGIVLQHAGRIDDALQRYREASRLDPQFVPALTKLSWILATHGDDAVRQPEESVQLAERAAALTEPRTPQVLDTLAAAYAAAGRFEEAVSAAESALKAGGAPQSPAARPIRSRLELYREGKPFREPHRKDAAPTAPDA